MKPTRPLITALALTLSAWPLCAQEPQPDRPPTPPPRDGGPARGDHSGPARRPLGGLFAALDANHDGVIDAQEMKQAAEVLARLDRNGDGRITFDELRPPGEGQRAFAGGRGNRESGPQSDVREPRGENRQAGPRREEERPRGPMAGNFHDGAAARGPEGERSHEPRGPVDGPRREGPPPPRDGDTLRGGRADGPREAHHGPPMSSGRFAQRGEGRPDFGRENFPAWHHQDRGSFGPLAMGPRMGDGRDFRGPGRGDFDPREFRNEMIARRLQEGEMRPPMPPAPGRERPDFRSQERPNFGPSEGDRGRGELRRPDDRGRDFGPRPPRGYRDYLPDGPPFRREIQ